MSEEEKINRSQEESSSSPYLDESSTIFTTSSLSEPKKKVGKDSQKRLILTIVSLALALVIGFGIFALSKWGPAVPDTTSSTETLYAVMMSKDTVTSVDIAYDGTKRTFLKSDGEEATWSITGIPDAYTSSSLIENYIAAFTNLPALETVSSDQISDEWFENDALTATIHRSDAEDLVIRLGKEVPALGGYYLSVRDGAVEKVYLINTLTAESLHKDSLDLAETTLFEALNQETNADYFISAILTYFDYFHIDGSNFKEPIAIYCDKNDISSNYYHMSSPRDRLVDAEALDDLLTMFSDGFAASGLYSYTHTHEEMSAYGLDDPIATLSAKVGTGLVKMKVGAEIDGYYPVLFGDNEPIYKIKTTNTSVAFVATPAEQYVSILTVSDNISTISAFRFLADGMDSTIRLTHDEADATNWAATLGAETLDTDSVRYLYQHIMMAAPLVTTFEADRSTIALKIILSYTDGTEKVLEFTVYPGSERRYVSWLNGEAQGIVAKDKVENLFNAAKKVLTGETIERPVA